MFSIISRDEIRTMLSFEAQKQALGCDEGASCLADLGGALGVRYIVSGSLGKVGEKYALQLVLSDIEKAKVDGRVNEQVDSQGKLLDATTRASQQLVGRILSDRQGTLIVTTEEVGAIVKIDGKNVGVTPLPRQKIGWGPHTVEVEKKGFITAIEDFTINSKGVIEKRFSLIPSPDFLKAYEADAQRMRIGAWIATAGAAIAVGAAGYFQLQHSGHVARFESLRLEYDRTEKDNDWPDFATQQASYQSLVDVKAAAEGAVLNARLSVGIGALLGLGAAFFWIAGEDPDRYARYRNLMSTPADAAEAPPAPAASTFLPTIDVTPNTQGGATLSARFALP